MWHGTWGARNSNISRNTNFPIITFNSRETYVTNKSSFPFTTYKIKKNVE